MNIVIEITHQLPHPLKSHFYERNRNRTVSPLLTLRYVFFIRFFKKLLAVLRRLLGHEVLLVPREIVIIIEYKLSLKNAYVFLSVRLWRHYIREASSVSLRR